MQLTAAVAVGTASMVEPVVDLAALRFEPDVAAAKPTAERTMTPAGSKKRKGLTANGRLENGSPTGIVMCQKGGA